MTWWPAKFATILLSVAGYDLASNRLELVYRENGAATAVSPLNRITYSDDRKFVVMLPGNSPRRIHSLLRVQDRLRYGEYAWLEMPAATGQAWVLVDLNRQILSIFRGGDEVGSAVILHGMINKPSPTGAFKVIERSLSHRSSLYVANMPYMLRITNDGIAIHASDVREAAATHGCIGIPEKFAKRLFAKLRVGDPVFIVREAEFRDIAADQYVKMSDDRNT